MKNVLFFIFLFFSGILISKAQLNVGSTAAPDASAMLQISGSAGGFRPPQISLGSTTSIGLTTPTVASDAKGMIVYNNNAGITGSSAYPAYGKGIYSWDGSGWVPFSYGSPTVLVANGNTSTAVANNTLTSILDISSVLVIKPDVTVTGSNTVNIATTGTYKIDVSCQGQLQSSNGANNAVLSCHVYKNGGSLDDNYVVQTFINASRPNFGAGNNYNIVSSFTVVLSAGDAITFKGSTLGEPAGVTTTFQIKDLKIERVL
ncbi:MAG TPA: hypothetical protein VKT28_14965 [Puia sp.]|nr:hypothetical protein [Puia sp.]